MELKNGMTVIAPCGTEKGLKKGDEFKIRDVCNNEPVSFTVDFAFDKGAFCLLKNCAHIGWLNWIIKSETP